MVFGAVLDTCVLYPVYLCDTLLRLGEEQFFRPVWSVDIVAELRRNLVEHGLALRDVERRIGQMQLAFPSATTSGYGGLIDAMEVDPKDRHVLAAAVRAGAGAIVTFNLKDFPVAAVAAHDVAVVHPDDFLLSCLELDAELTLDVLRTQLASYRREPRTVKGLFTALERGGVPRFADSVRMILT